MAAWGGMGSEQGLETMVNWNAPFHLDSVVTKNVGCRCGNGLSKWTALGLCLTVFRLLLFQSTRGSGSVEALAR